MVARIEDVYINCYCVVNSLSLYIFYSKDDRLPNLDATQRKTDTENKSQVVIPTGERKHFPSNITKTGYAIFSVSCTCIITYPCTVINVSMKLA